MNTFELHKLVLSAARYTDWTTRFLKIVGETYGSNINNFYFDDNNLYIDIDFTGIDAEVMATALRDTYINIIENLILEGVPGHIFFAADKAIALYAFQLLNLNRLAFRKMCEGTITIINFTIDPSNPRLRINFHN